MKRSVSSAPAQSPSKPVSALSTVRIWADKLFSSPSLKHTTLSSSATAHRRSIDPHSLQFRLALGVTAFSILGLGGVATWTSWKMQQILVNTHLENVKQIGDRIPQDVRLYGEMGSVETGMQRVIDNLASLNLFIWVTQPDGALLAQSQALQTAPPSFVSQLQSVSEMPVKPEVYQIGDRYFVLCSVPLVVEGQAVGQLHLAEEITADQLQLNAAIQGLSLVSVLSIVLMATAIALYIRQSLQPLRKISQVAGTISANDLSQAKLSLSHAPTEVKELAATLNAMLSRLALSWEQQQQLIGNISHELRTPLTVTYGYLQCMQRRSANLNPTQQEMLETALAETDRTIQLLQSLLDLARADHGCIYLHPETFLLNDLVADVAELEERSTQCKIEIEAEDAIWINSDRNCLSQILTHLTNNAAKHSAPSQPILIRLAQTPDQQVTIQVYDSGEGIAPDQQERVFERFYRIDNARSRATGGVGLGLAIAKTLVEEIGGQIHLWSQPGEGSIFTITIPSKLKDEAP